MNTEISENAVVVLLLTAPFIRGRKKSNSKVKLLSPSEFNDLNNKLIRLKMQPSMLLEKEGLDHLLENIVKLSEFIYIYKDFVKEVEMNPLVIKEDMVIGLDALIIPNLEGEKNA